MSEVRIPLSNPLLVFIYSLSLLLAGCAIGMHWYQSRASAIWIAVAAASLMVVHDMFAGMIWCSAISGLLRKLPRNQSQ